MVGFVFTDCFPMGDAYSISVTTKASDTLALLIFFRVLDLEAN